MNSNKKIQPNQTLYLKQFFSNYFQRKSMLETVSNFNNGLQVLESLIQNFQRTHSITKMNKKEKKECRLENQFASDIEKEGKSINRMLEDIYNRLKNIFETVQQSKEKYPQQYSHCHLQTYNQCNDDELYQILNKYKNDLKKEKQGRINLQREIQKLQDSIQNERSEKKNATQQCHKIKLNCEILKQKNKLLQDEVKELRQQIEMFLKQKSDWEQRMEEYANLQLTINHLSQETQTLKQQLFESHQRQKISAQKMKHIDSIVKAKIAQNETKWSQIIDEKINRKNIYTIPTCKVFKEFINGFNIQNRPSINKQ